MKHSLALIVLTGLIVTACDKPAVDNPPKEQAVLPEIGAASGGSIELETGESGDEGIQSEPDKPNMDNDIITQPPIVDMPPDIVPEKPVTEPVTEPSSVTPTN